MLFGKFENETGLIETKAVRLIERQIKGRKTLKLRETPKHR